MEFKTRKIEENWDQSCKQAAHERWPELSETELVEARGRRTYLVDALIRHGREPGEVGKELDAFEAANTDKPADNLKGAARDAKESADERAKSNAYAEEMAQKGKADDRPDTKAGFASGKGQAARPHATRA